MHDFELFSKRASVELERIFHIEPYSDDLVVPLGSWRANHNREATKNLIDRNRSKIMALGDNFEEAMNYLINLLKILLMDE